MASFFSSKCCSNESRQLVRDCVTGLQCQRAVKGDTQYKVWNKCEKHEVCTQWEVNGICQMYVTSIRNSAIDMKVRFRTRWFHFTVMWWLCVFNDIWGTALFICYMHPVDVSSLCLNSHFVGSQSNCVLHAAYFHLNQPGHTGEPQS